MVQFAGSLASERKCQNTARIDLVGNSPIGNATREHARLSRASTGADNQQFGLASDTGPLFVIEPSKNLGRSCIVHGTTLATPCDIDSIAVGKPVVIHRRVGFHWEVASALASPDGFLRRST